MSRDAKRVLLGVAGLVFFGVSWFLVFRFPLPYIWLIPGPLIFMICSLGSERLVPLTAGEQAEKDKEAVEESIALDHLGFWRFTLLGILQLIFVAIVMLGVFWFNDGFSFSWLTPRTAIVMTPVAVITLFLIPISYWYDRYRLRKKRDEIDQKSRSTNS